MTSIFYPLLISMLPPPLSPPPPPPDLPPHPPRPPPPPVRSSPSSSRPVNSFRPPPTAASPPSSPPALSLVQPAPRPSVLRENVHVHRAHSRRNNHFFVPDNTRSRASPARPANSPRLPTTSRNPRHYPSHPLSIFSSNLFSSPALLLHPPNHPGSLPPAFSPSLPLCHLLSNRAKSN